VLNDPEFNAKKFNAKFEDMLRGSNQNIKLHPWVSEYRSEP
jgi:hypothetical protein